MFGPPKNLKKRKPLEPVIKKVKCDLEVCASKPIRETKREKNIVSGAVELQRQKEYQWLLYQSKSRDHLDRKQLLTNLKEEVKHTLYAYDNDLRKKREKLRRLLLQEEEALYKEAVAQAQTDSEKRYDLMKERLQHLKDTQEDKRMELKNKKTLQLYLNICEDLRPEASRAMLIESKRSQLQQMEDKKIIRYYQDKKEEMWQEVSDRERQQALDYHKLEQQRLKDRNKCIVKTLHEQVLDKHLAKCHQQELKLLDRAKMDENVAVFKKDELERKQLEHEKKLKYKYELETQIVKNAKYARDEKQKLKTIDDTFAKYIKDFMEQQKRETREDKVRMYNETEMYLEDLQKYHQNQLCVDKLRERLVEQDRVDKDTKNLAASAKIRNWSDKIRYDSFVQSKQLIKHKLDALAKEKQDKKESDLLDQQIRQQQQNLEDLYNAEKYKKNREFGEFILQQARDKKVKQMEEKCADRSYDHSILVSQQNKYKNCLAHMNLLEKGSLATNVFTKYIQDSCDCGDPKLKQRSLRFQKADQEEYDKVWRQKNYTLPDYPALEKKC